MESKPPAKAPAITALKCLNPDCNGLLAYEVTTDNVLYIDLAYTACTDGDLRFFPCPKCGGRNVLEPAASKPGAMRVARWQPAAA